MPIPQTARGAGITNADFTAPFDTPIYPLGNGGINLASAIDAVPVGQFTRLTNVDWVLGEPRALTGRPGQTLAASVGSGTVHSIIRLTDLQTSTRTYLWGEEDHLLLGDLGGAMTVLETGFSGDPLSLLPGHPPLSGDPWVYVGDSALMCKVRFDGLVTEIGLPAPGTAAAVALATEQITNIARGTTTADAWTANPGYDYSSPPLVAAAGTTTTDALGSTFDANPGNAVLAAGNGYWCFWGCPKTLNLDVVGAYEASDDDLMHMAFKIGNPSLVAEVRIYLVCSPVFSPSVLPGSSVDAGGAPTDANTEFYMKAFRPDDFAAMVQTFQSQVSAAETARINQLRQQALTEQAKLERYLLAPSTNRAQRYVRAQSQLVQSLNAQLAASQRDPTRNQSVQASGANNQYLDFGTVGIPLRRGEWKRFGNTAAYGWGTITGLVVYLQALPNAAAANPLNLLIYCSILEWYLTGGSGPDVTEPDAQSYDYRATHYDPRTGVEGNPSPIMAEANWANPLRRGVNVTPQAYGDSAMRQRVYRRGGSLTEDWFYCGVNDSDGGVFLDRNSDFAIAAAGTVETDHYQPVPTVDDAGETVLAQPLPILFGPYNGQMLGLGDPYRPGYVYASLPNQPDLWPPDLITEVCPPSEQLMSGCMYGGNAYVFSREAGYAIYGQISGSNGLSSAPTGCKHGLASRWALAVGAGAMWIGSTDGIYKVGGGGAEDLVSQPIGPLFHGQSVNGYFPIDLTEEARYRLAVYDNCLWVTFQDTEGDQQVWVLQILTGQWKHYGFARELAVVYPDLAQLLLGGLTTGEAYTHSGTSDDGVAIAAEVRTASTDWGRPREEKLLGDQIIDLDPKDLTLTWTNYLNSEAVINTPIDVGGFDGRQRVILDSFGVIPQRARNLAVDLAWSATTAPPILYFLGTSITPQPDITMNRVTNWDDLGRADPSYVMGITLDCDTGGGDRTIVVEGDLNGVITTLSTITVNTDGRHKVAFTWLGQRANMVRLRPESDCGPWVLYRADWNTQPEPPRIAGWDAYFENGWDQYYTGLDLYCDTGGATKTVAVEVDGVVLTNPETGNAWWEVIAGGRQVVHLTLPTGRGHVFRFYATDANVGSLYQFRWHLVEEPSEQSNWNSPYTILGTQADKYLKGIVFEVDCFALDKTVSVEADGVVVDTLTIPATNGRKVVQLSLTNGQQLGRVWRIIPTDFNPSRLYSLRPIFDEEPFALTAWNTQLIDHGFDGYHYLVDAMITLKSNDAVTLTLVGQYNQSSGASFTDTYTIPSTAGVKQKVFLPFEARKAVLYQYFLDADSPFWLYREESYVRVQDWQGGGLRQAHVFGNDDLDPTRGMTNATLAAARSGGSA